MVLHVFSEDFHRVDGAGLGASHETGWTGLVAVVLDLFGRLRAKAAPETERAALGERLVIERVRGVTTGRA